MTYRLTETTPPAEEPVTLAEAKAHLRVDHDSDNALVAQLVSAARLMCEAYTGRAFVDRNYSLFLDAFPDGDSVSLPRPPLSSVTSLLVYDDDGSSDVYAASQYFAETAGTPGRIILKDGVTPPQPARKTNGIEIRFTAGYGAAADVPAVLKQAVLQVTGALYEHRGDGEADALALSGALGLLRAFRVMGLS